MDLPAGWDRSRLAREAKQFNHPPGGPLCRGGVIFVSEAEWANGFGFKMLRSAMRSAKGFCTEA
eukprot:1589039-Prymnesium_polylepis.1